MTWFSLIPNARTELAAIAGPPVAGGKRRRAAYGVEIRANGAAVPGEARVDVGAEILGAGDVVGIDPRMIARVEPASGANGFEPNYMPFVEFADADFPWRYSFDPSVGTRVTPWLVLLALKPGEFEFLDQGSAHLQRILIPDPGASLPDLSQSWAFAHVHLSHGEQRSNDLAGLIASRPDMHLSRLMCLRRLEPNTTYTLVLVPSTEAGRLAGLARNETAEPFDKRAWDASTAAGLELPVYHQTRFVTSVLEDFEILARRLKPFQMSSDSHVALPVEAFAGAPGFYAGYSNPSATFEVQDALMRADHSVQPFNTDPELTALLIPTLEAVIAGETVAPDADGPDREDPLVAMPPYGWRFRRQEKLDAASAEQGAVVDRINLDLKFRHAAGLGAETVRRNQEHFSRICWSQYRDIVEANLALARLKTAKQLGASVAMRHVAGLPAPVVAALSETVRDLAMLSNGRTAAELYSSAGVPASFTSRALRRVASKRTLRPVVSAPAGGIPRAFTPMPVAPGERTTTRAEPEVPDIHLRERRFEMPAPARSRIVALFGADAIITGRLSPSRAIAVHPVDAASVVSAVRTLFAALPNRKAEWVIGGLAGIETEKLDPIMRAPVVSDPLVQPLIVFESRAILRASDSLPNNTVSVVKENRAFVEAFLVGANHEMNNELRWREFPTDMRGTIFRRFWDRKRAPSDPAGDDIPEIHGWTQLLGSNYPAHDIDRKEALVVLVRGDLIRKYGQILVTLNRASSTSYVHGAGTDFSPIFAGQFAPDICYYGFDVDRDSVLADKARHFFVLYEVPGRVRFGLDVATAVVRRSRFAFRTAALAFPLATLGRDATKALLPEHLKTGNPPPALASKWDELSWEHMQLDSAGYINTELTALGVTEAPNYWSANRDAASLARSFWQKPIAAVLPAARVL
jgi:hypothetical protein